VDSSLSFRAVSPAGSDAFPGVADAAFCFLTGVASLACSIDLLPAAFLVVFSVTGGVEDSGAFSGLPLWHPLAF